MENEKYVEIFWDDLTEEAQRRIINFIGDNGNYDVFPIATIYGDEEIVEESAEDESENMEQAFG